MFTRLTFVRMFIKKEGEIELHTMRFGLLPISCHCRLFESSVTYFSDSKTERWLERYKEDASCMSRWFWFGFRNSSSSSLYRLRLPRLYIDFQMPFDGFEFYN